MRLPEATEQVKILPIRALRAIFSGIGQLLLAADRFRAEEADRADSGPDAQYDPLRAWDAETTPPAASPAGAGPEPAKSGKLARREKATGREKATRPRESKSTGKAKGAEKMKGAGKAKKAEKGGRTAPRSRQVAEEPRFRSLDSTGNVRVLGPEDIAELSVAETDASAPIPEPTPSPEPADLPVPSYDDLSLPSLRSRLRNLDIAQLRVLVDYEKSHARREDIITMFERRIVKLGAAASDAT